jgi:hypothetical protein
MLTRGAALCGRARHHAETCCPHPGGELLLAWPLGDENSPSRPGNDQSFVHEDLDRATGSRPGDAVAFSQPVEAWHLFTGQKLAVSDLLSQFGRNPQIGRHQLSGHKINVPSRLLTCDCTSLCCAVLD